jgi:hypothetical protein
LPLTSHRRPIQNKPLLSAVAAGLALSQLVATVFVYRANSALAQKIAALGREGYLVVPGPSTLPPLQSFSAAFWGGLFYTLSVGAALTLLGLAAARLYTGLRRGRRLLVAAYALVGVGLLTAVNADGFAPIVSFYFVLVPPSVYAVIATGYRPAADSVRRSTKIIPILAALGLAVFWTTQLNDRLFLNIRDYFLLSNSIGTRVNDFYYRYTLFAAEPFKSLNQKTLHTCNISGVVDSEIQRRVEKHLRSHDYLAVRQPPPVDLTLSSAGGELVFTAGGRPILRAEPAVFFSAPAELLRVFSERTDRYGFFRSFTFYSILLAFPLLLFTLIYGLLRRLTDLFLSPGPATVVSAAVCLLLGASPIVPLHLAAARPVAPAAAEVTAVLASGHWRQRVAALRTIEQHELEIADVNGHRHLRNAAQVAVRYWYVRALSVSRRPETAGDLLQFLDDPQPIVVCQALYALGKRRHRSATGAVVNTLKRSSSWYVQHYAYRALRSLGWKQPVSN